MKISYMLKREDFYKINEQTLKSFFDSCTKKTKLYVYPELNAIVCKHPSKDVKKYIYTEYKVNAGMLKRILVWLYTRLSLNSFGLLASKRIFLNANITKNMLIYPCNRKYRVFDFKNNEVSVIAKAGFPANSLKNEIDFRSKNSECDFILPIDRHSESAYTEKIIDGTPLARISINNEALKQNALQLWREYSKETKKNIKAPEYASLLRSKIDTTQEKLKSLNKNIDYTALNKICDKYLPVIEGRNDNIELIQSHGDLQAGNIWVENETDKIYIIDWESVSERSVWYDEVVLFSDIRKTHNLEKFVEGNELKHFVVILEEIIYRLNELLELPFDYSSDDFNRFIKLLEKSGNKNV